ncbi:hypothetical protein KC336_g62 [Hortaea werneckii]|nr:hypothetical protein KC336_g62 [Hortaea werneckii]
MTLKTSVVMSIDQLHSRKERTTDLRPRLTVVTGAEPNKILKIHQIRAENVDGDMPLPGRRSDDRPTRSALSLSSSGLLSYGYYRCVLGPDEMSKASSQEHICVPKAEVGKFVMATAAFVQVGVRESLEGSEMKGDGKMVALVIREP